MYGRKNHWKRKSKSGTNWFERGVDSENCLNALLYCGKIILDTCGGVLEHAVYNNIIHANEKKIIELDAGKVNRILGTEFSKVEMERLLESTFFDTDIHGETLLVEIPSYRGDVEYDVDLIEEVARMYGYHNIEEKLPDLNVPVVKNRTKENADKLREILTGFGFIECLTYGFIPEDSMERLKILEGTPYYGNIKLQNPLSKQYALMRPNMIHSTLDTVLYNASIGKQDLRIFEIGRVYKRDCFGDLGYIEKDTLAVAMTGKQLGRGFHIPSDIKFNIYDAINILNSIFDEFNMICHLKEEEYKFFEKGISAGIYCKGERVGCIGQISKEVLGNYEKGKLIKSDLIYFEMEYTFLGETKKIIKFQSDFPSIRREYNLLCNKELNFEDYREDVQGISDLIIKTNVVDVYQGKGVPEGKISVLMINIEYNGGNRTLESSEVEVIEGKMLTQLKKKYDIGLKV